MLRIGEGFDIHRLVEGRRLIIGGVQIDHHKGLLGHSDADVLIHAIVDALLGALSLGDIGSMFPDDTPQYKDADSRSLLRLAGLRIKNDEGYEINNIDTTVIIESPRLKAYIPQMCANIAADLDIATTQINIKAKTHEGIGDVGAGNAAIAKAVVLLIR